MRSKALIAVLLLLALPLLAAEPKPRPTKSEAVVLVRAWLDAERAYQRIPAVSAAVVHDQDVVWSGGSGADADTIYSICSISKLFTSIAVMQLRDEGKLSLDEPVAKVLPWFAVKPAPDGGTVTIENLLTHSSGLDREADYPYWTGNFEFPTHEQIVERLKTQSQLYPADAVFQYSNLGLTLAGEVVAVLSHQPYEEYVRQHILQPIGLQSTTPQMPEAERGKRLAAGYSAVRRDGTRTLLPFFTARGIAPAAGFASTANDLAKFAAWQFRVLGGGDAVLRARTLREMQRIHFVDPDFAVFRGLGFNVIHRDDKLFTGHPGACPGYRTELLLQPAEKIGIVFMANAADTDSGAFAFAMYDLVAPALMREDDAAPAAALAPYAGSYSALPFGGETIFFSWGGQLASLNVPQMTPKKSITSWRTSGEHAFRRVRNDGSLGEEIVFDVGPDGRARSVRRFSNSYPRMEGAGLASLR
ncbi:MAG TPA: serine hydrolase domain-containing protein [Thermoanaerobaculia bacterium]|nr:serine hydrolase domain-containing protein [Thermoanaerobaculia bacterium]